MNITNIQPLLSRIQDALARDDVESAIRILEAMRSADQARLLDDLDQTGQVLLISNLEPTVSAEIIEEMEDSGAASLIASVPAEDAVSILNEMAPDEAADLLGDIPLEQAQRLISELEHPEEVTALLRYPDDSAGGLMTSETFALRGSMSVEQAMDAIRRERPDLENAYNLFVVDEGEHLRGVVSLQALIMADPATRLEAVMDADVLSVFPELDQEKTAWIMSHYDLVMLPVVDHDLHMLGVITVDDVVDVLVDEATEDIQRLGGAQPLEQPYLNTAVSRVTRLRIGWLLLLFITESLTGSVLRHFEDELSVVVSLSFFIPLLIGTGGNAGSQATSTIIRAIAVGELGLKDGLRVLWHELRVGLLLGAGMSVVAYLRALSWGSSQGLAITVAVAILAIVIWANSLGALLPLLATRLKIDPTVVSGPVMSTLVDATGLYIYFTIARIIMRL